MIEIFKNNITPTIGKKLLHEIFNHPFTENRSRFFKKQDWDSYQFENEFFIEKPNFDLILHLLEITGNNQFIICSAHSHVNTTFYELKDTIDLEYTRSRIDEKPEWFIMDWYIFDKSKRWGCITEYDKDALYLGVEKGLISKSEIVAFSLPSESPFRDSES